MPLYEFLTLLSSQFSTQTTFGLPRCPALSPRREQRPRAGGGQKMRRMNAKEPPGAALREKAGERAETGPRGGGAPVRGGARAGPAEGGGAWAWPGPRGGGWGEGRFEGAGLLGRGAGNPNAGARVPAGRGGAREVGGVARGGPQQRSPGGGAGAPGRASGGCPPPSRGRRPGRCRSVRWLVRWLVGQGAGGLWLGSPLSCSEVGGTREPPTHLRRRERRRGPALRSVESLHAPGLPRGRNGDIAFGEELENP